jgi:hypothetical protein
MILDKEQRKQLNYKSDMNKLHDKPEVKLIGEDGNAFYILHSCRHAALKAKWTKEQIKEFEKKAMSGDYNNLLVVVQEYFKVV